MYLRVELLGYRVYKCSVSRNPESKCHSVDESEGLDSGFDRSCLGIMENSLGMKKLFLIQSLLPFWAQFFQ